MEDCDEEQSILAAREQEIIQTVLIEAMEPDQSKSEITRIFMNTCSKKTYIKEIVKKLKHTTKVKSNSPYSRLQQTKGNHHSHRNNVA